jgi:glycosyltransferase involved in cell wall biosynthesis
LKISIVTLSFNQRAYLKEAMESVLSQGYSDLEYIIVDPGSTDGSRELIRSYGARIPHVIFEPDRGAADGLNKGFALATGDVYGFLNADDVLMPGSLREIADFFTANSECSLAFGSGHIIDSNGRVIRRWKARDFTVRRYFYGGTQWLQQSTFFRSDIYLQSPRFNVENRTCWDGELFVTMANQGAKVGYIRSDLAGFRIHNESISGSGQNKKQYRDDFRRMFRDIRGRNWNAIDELLQFAYRAEGVLIRTGSRFHDSDRKVSS